MALVGRNRAVWKARIDINRRTGRIADGESYVGKILLKRLGQDGRCDPSLQTLAKDSGKDVSTVQQALKAFYACGMVTWVRRLRRNGTRVSQDTNAYVLTLGEPPNIPLVRCDRQPAQETCSLDKSRELLPLPSASASEVKAAKAALADRQRVMEARLLNKGWGKGLATRAIG